MVGKISLHGQRRDWRCNEELLIELIQILITVLLMQYFTAIKAHICSNICEDYGCIHKKHIFISLLARAHAVGMTAGILYQLRCRLKPKISFCDLLFCVARHQGGCHSVPN